MKKLGIIQSIIVTIFFVSSIYPQNFWQQLNGPYGGATIKDFLRYNDSIIFIATLEGIIKSVDNSETWNRTLSWPSRVSCLAADKFGQLYAGAKDIYNNCYLLKSTDEGNNWFNINSNFWADITCILIPHKDTIVLGTWDKGFFRSYDSGLTWLQINNGIQYVSIYKVILLSNGDLLAGSSGGGVYKSTNWGDIWTVSNSGLPSNSEYYFAESFCEINPGYILAGASAGIYHSSNFGNTWFYKSLGYDNKVATCIIKDLNGNVYAGTDVKGGVFYSTNNGSSWFHFGLGNNIYTLGFDSENRLYAGGLNDGLFKFQTDDSIWVQVYNRGYTPVYVDRIYLTKSGNLIVSTHWEGIHYSTNDGSTWRKLNFNDGGNIPFVMANDSVFFAGGVSVTFDTGKTWTNIGNYNSSSLFYHALSQKLYLGTIWPDSDPNHLCEIHVTSDYGQNWIKLSTFPKVGQTRWVNTLQVTGKQNCILASIYTGDRWGSTSSFIRSTDQGFNWTEISNNYIKRIHEDRDLNLYALGQWDLFVSTDEGESWITHNNIQSNCIVSDNSNRIFIAWGRNIKYSIDKGITWYPLPSLGIDDPQINDVAISMSNKIYLATERGIFVGDGDSIMSVSDEINQFNHFGLLQNYPNPFNPSTKIRYAIPLLGGDERGGLVTLKVFDILGNEVATLVNEYKPVGYYEVEFSVGQTFSLSSGVYYYQLRAGGFVQTKKMVLLK